MLRKVWHAFVRVRDEHSKLIRVYINYIVGCVSPGNPYSLRARILSLIYTPILVYEKTGVVPLEKTHLSNFKVNKAMPTPDISKSVAPHSIFGDRWDKTEKIYTEQYMGYVVFVNKGVALSTGYNLDNAGRLIEGASHRYISSRNKKKFQRNLNMYGPFANRILPFEKIVKIRGEVITLAASNSETYFHWMFDVLPRLGMVNKQVIERSKIFISQKESFQRESINAIGLPQDQIIQSHDKTLPIIQADNLIIPCQQFVVGLMPSQQVISFLRTVFLKANVKSVAFPKRFYITRKNARWRRVINEKDILPIFKSYGIEVIEESAMSFLDGVRLFENAELIVAQEGSGLANLVFCKEKTKLLELFPSTTRALFYTIASHIKMDYHYIVNGENVMAKRKLNNDVTIDKVKLEKALENMC